MTIRYGVKGEERKRLAEYIAAFLGCEKKFLGPPSFAYRSGYIDISRDGTVSFDDRADSEEIEALLEELEGIGFMPQDRNTAAQAADNAEISSAGDNRPDCGKSPQIAATGLTVRVPMDSVDAGKLTHILEARGALIKKAVGVDSLPIRIEEDAVAFPWFADVPDPGETKAYRHFIAALCGMSKNRKRITASERPVENEKYAFRCFLLQLGFIGEEYRDERKILLKNLSGSSAFKSGSKGGARRETS